MRHKSRHSNKGKNEMKTYSEKFWSEIDRPSRETVSAFFSKFGQVEGSTGNCWYDLVWTYKDRKIAIEIKDRNFTHDRYGDIMCEEIKKDCFLRDKSRKLFDGCIVVNVFTDKVIAMCNIEKGRSQNIGCPKTTMLDDHEYVKKSVWKMP